MSNKTATLRKCLWTILVSFAVVGASLNPRIIEAKLGNLFKQESLPNSPRLLKPQRSARRDNTSPGQVVRVAQPASTSLFSRPLSTGLAGYADLLGFLGIAPSQSLVARQVRVVGTSFNPGQQGSVTIDLDSQGDENAIGFSLTFETSKLTYASAVAGSDAISATFNVNTLQVASGRLGLAIAFQSGGTFTAGTRHMAVVTFNVASAATGSTGIGFGNQPIFRETADVVANVLPTDYPPTPTQFPINVVPNPVPTLGSVTPNSAIAGSSGFTLNISGTNFVSGSIVKFNGTDLVTSFVSGTQLTAQLPTAAIGTAGNANVTVFNPAPGGGTSSAVNFAINNPVPTIASLTPTSATAGGGAVVLTVDGSNFVLGSVVTFNGSNRSASFVTNSQLALQLSAADVATAGIFPITVQNPGPGGGNSSAVNFTVNNPVPTLSSLTPTSTTVGGAAFALTVNGTNFVNGSVVKINGSNRTTTFVSSTQLTAQILASDLGSVGSLAITVQNSAPGGGTSSALNLNVNNPAPVVSSLSPANVTAGGPAFTLTVNGSNFVSTSVVKLNGSNRTTTFASSTQLTAQLAAADIANVGVIPITVFSPTPGGGTSSALNLNVNNPAPVITNLAPASVPAGNIAFTLTVNGSNFASGAVVKFNGSDRTTSFGSSAQVTAQITAADVAAAGTFQVLVVNPAPGGGTSSPVDFTVNNPAPTLGSLVPTSATVGGAALNLTVNGSNFVNGSVVKFNGSNRTTSFVSNSQLTAQLTAADLATAGIFPVTVQTAGPGGGTSGALNFTVNNPAPSLTSLAPAAATLGDPALALTVNGSNFINGSVVKFNGSNRTTSFVSNSQLTAQLTVADLATAGISPVTVQTAGPGGGTSGALNFTVNNPAPTLSSLAPTSAIVGGAAFTLTVNGSNFVNGAVVKFNGSNRTTSFVGSSQLTAQITAADIQSTVTALITVANPGGGASGALDFNVVNPGPVLSSLAPATVTAGGPAFTLTVNGSNFVNTSVVKLNGSDRVTSFVSSTQLTAQLAAADIANADALSITVFSPAPGGGTSTALNLNVNNPAPAITTLAPANVTAGSAAFALAVNGSNFVNGAVVKFNGSDRVTSFVSGAQLTAQLTAADVTAAGNFSVLVVNPAPGGGSSSPVNFTVNNPAPSLTSLAPATATVGDPAFTLTVDGSNFIDTSVIKLNGNDRVTSFVSSTQLTAQITAVDVQSSGARTITVFSPAPGGGTSNALNLNVNNPAPAITTLAPASVTSGSANFTLTVNGTNFVSGAVVKWNGSDCPTNFVSGNQLTTQVPAADVATAGTVPVMVVNPAPGGGSSSPANFTVNNPVPTIGTLSPTSAMAGVPAFTLTVNGSNFVNGSMVMWNGSDRVTSFVSSSQLTAQILSTDTSVAGAFPIAVRNASPGGGASNAVGLTVMNPTPALSNISPTNVNAGSAGFTLSVTGTSFVAGSVVRLNNSDHLTTFVDSTHLTTQVNAADIGAAGTILITVFNPLPGGGSSNSLNLTVDPASPGAREIQVIGVTTIVGYDVVIPIELISHGDENALGFSLVFDPTQLTFVSAALGVDASTASLVANGTAATGHIGIAVALPAGTTFSAGARQIVNVTFTVPMSSSAGLSPLTFDDFPISREVVDITAFPLPTAFSSGALTIAQSYEADVAPRPQGHHDGTVTVQDWNQIGRFMALFDTVSLGSEFQRADCAPKATQGDGRISVADWAQAGRYAAILDPVTFAGGPTGPVVPTSPEAASTVDGEFPASVIRITTGLVRPGQPTAVSVDLEAQGNENAIGFSLMFNPAVLSFISAERGRDAGESVLQINRVNSGKGRVGIALALPTERAFDAGKHQIVTLNFVMRADVEGAPALEFSDLPIDREVVDVRATPLKAAFVRQKADDKNPIDDTQFFVQQQYLDFLSRKPDAAGLDYWTAQITQCGADAVCIRNSRIRVSAAFFMAQEFQQTGFFIHRLYKGTMGRNPTYQEFMAERSRLMNLSSLENGKQAMVESWLARPELQDRYPLTLNDEAFVDVLLMTVREGSGVDLSNERQDLIARIASNGRAHVVHLVMENPAFVRAEYNPAFVLSEYFGYLRREPDPAGYEFWLSTLNNREPDSYHAMVCAFLTSPEYQRRFGSAVTRTNAECGP
jgi:Domain of unknown function (DUF4214)